MQTYLWVIFDLLNTSLRLLGFLFKPKKEMLLNSFSTGLTVFHVLCCCLCLSIFRNWLPDFAFRFLFEDSSSIAFFFLAHCQ